MSDLTTFCLCRAFPLSSPSHSPFSFAFASTSLHFASLLFTSLRFSSPSAGAAAEPRRTAAVAVTFPGRMDAIFASASSRQRLLCPNRAFNTILTIRKVPRVTGVRFVAVFSYLHLLCTTVQYTQLHGTLSPLYVRNTTRLQVRTSIFCAPAFSLSILCTVHIHRSIRGAFHCRVVSCAVPSRAAPRPPPLSSDCFRVARQQLLVREARKIK